MQVELRAFVPYRCTMGECLAGIVGRLGNLLPPREALHAWPRPEVAREGPQGGNAAYRAQPGRYPVSDVHQLSSLTHLVRPGPRGYGEKIHAAANTWIEALCCQGLPSPATAEVEVVSGARGDRSCRLTVKRMP